MRLHYYGLILAMAVFGSGCAVTSSTPPKDAKLAAELNAKLGLEYMHKGRYEVALLKLEKAIEFDEDNANAYHYKAELHRRLKQYDKAEENFRQAFELAPDDALLRNNYGVFLCDQKKYDEALKHFDEVIKNPLYGAKDQAYENIGLCTKRQGYLRKSEQAFRQALKLNPKLPQSLLNMAQYSFDAGNKRQAYDYFKRYIALAPHTSESLWLGILLERERHNKNTVASYAVLLKGKFPDSEEADWLRKMEQSGRL